jgi:molecular chaperone GrpE
MPENDPSIPSPETDDVHPAEDLSANESTQAQATPVDPLEQALLEVEKWKDLAYRSQAELDNFRKRATREGQETRAFANGELLRSVLPILDNFEMGLNAARAESEKSMIFMGMQMVHRQFQEFLKDFGVQEVEAHGKPFDPNVHEAVSQEVTAEHAEGTIIRVTRPGYRLKERLLRPASVIVAAADAPDSAPQA